MQNYECEMHSIELARHWMHHLRACLEMVREKATADPEGARCLFQPAVDLASELRATQVTLDSLTEDVQSSVEIHSVSS